MEDTVKSQLNLSINQIIKSDLQEIEKWFVNDSFYYDTMFPDSEHIEEVRHFLSYNSSRFAFIELLNEDNNCTKIGIFDVMVNTSTAKAQLELQLCTSSHWNSIGAEIVSFLTRYLYSSMDINRIIKYVYECDMNSGDAFIKAGYSLDGKYRSLLYKNRRYWDVMVYSTTRQNFFRNGK